MKFNRGKHIRKKTQRYNLQCNLEWATQTNKPTDRQANKEGCF